MLVCDYIVEQIDGDYAHLRRTDLPDEELKLVARALLPAEIVEGCTRSCPTRRPKPSWAAKTFAVYHPINSERIEIPFRYDFKYFKEKIPFRSISSHAGNTPERIS